MAVITYKGVLEVLDCGVCHVDFAIDQGWLRDLQQTGKDFWCPNGHQISLRTARAVRARAHPQAARAGRDP